MFRIVSAAGERFRRDAQAATTAVVSSRSPEGKLAGLRSLRTAATTAANRFRNLTLRANAARIRSALVAGLTQLSRDTLATEHAVHMKNQALATSLVTRLQDEQRNIPAALDGLKRQVY
jgi:hypothetical protein